MAQMLASVLALSICMSYGRPPSPMLDMAQMRAFVLALSFRVSYERLPSPTPLYPFCTSSHMFLRLGIPWSTHFPILLNTLFGVR